MSIETSFDKHRRVVDDIRCTFKCRSARLQLISERESAESLNRESEVDSLRTFDATQNTDTTRKLTRIARRSCLPCDSVCVQMLSSMR